MLSKSEGKNSCFSSCIQNFLVAVRSKSRQGTYIHCCRVNSSVYMPFFMATSKAVMMIADPAVRYSFLQRVLSVVESNQDDTIRRSESRCCCVSHQLTSIEFIRRKAQGYTVFNVTNEDSVQMITERLKIFPFKHYSPCLIFHGF